VENDTDNKGLQQTIFIISIVLVAFGLIMIITSGISKLFEFDTSFLPPTTKWQPFFLVFVFAIAALYFSSRNLKRLRNKNKAKD
jgi:protein-S-isoprenylcysteine O-methyltransferase Ste14